MWMLDRRGNGRPASARFYRHRPHRIDTVTQSPPAPRLAFGRLFWRMFLVFCPRWPRSACGSAVHRRMRRRSTGMQVAVMIHHTPKRLYQSLRLGRPLDAPGRRLRPPDPPPRPGPLLFAPPPRLRRRDPPRIPPGIERGRRREIPGRMVSGLRTLPRDDSSRPIAASCSSPSPGTPSPGRSRTAGRRHLRPARVERFNAVLLGKPPRVQVRPPAAGRPVSSWPTPADRWAATRTGAEARRSGTVAARIALTGAEILSAGRCPTPRSARV